MNSLASRHAGAPRANLLPPLGSLAEYIPVEVNQYKYMQAPPLASVTNATPKKATRKASANLTKRKKVPVGNYSSLSLADFVLYTGELTGNFHFNKFINTGGCYSLPENPTVFMLDGRKCPASMQMASVQRYLNRQFIFGKEYSFSLNKQTGNLLCVPRDD